MWFPKVHAIVCVLRLHCGMRSARHTAGMLEDTLKNIPPVEQKWSVLSSFLDSSMLWISSCTYNGDTN